MLASNTVAKFHDYGVTEQNPPFGEDCVIEPESDRTRLQSQDNDDAILMTSSLSERNDTWALDQKTSHSINEMCKFEYDEIENSLQRSLDSDLKTAFDLQSELFGYSCGICRKSILSPYLFAINGRRYHEKCLTCAICGESFGASCFVKEGKFYCKEDYIRIWKTCRICNERIETGDTYVTLSTSHICHVSCLKCNECKVIFQQGDKCHITNHDTCCFACNKCWEASHKAEATCKPTSNEGLSTSSVYSNDQNITQRRHSHDVTVATNDINQAMTSPRSQSSIESSKSEDITAISEDEERENVTAGSYLNNDTDGDRDDVTAKDEADVDDKRVKRPRTILSALQRKRFTDVFQSSQKPTRKAREALASETGLSVRVVQVWFQNQRAKMKKMAKRHQGNEHSITSRDQYGYHGYDHVMPLTHPAFHNEQAIADLRFNSFPNRQQDMVPWEGAQGIHPDLYSNTSCYMERTHPIDHANFAENIISSPQFGDLSSLHFPAAENPIDQTIPTNNIPPISETPLNRPISNDDMQSAIDGLYALQNPYFNAL